MTTLPIEQRIPGTLIYGGPEECHTTLAQGIRCESDPRWQWPAQEPPLPRLTLHSVDLAVILCYKQMRWRVRKMRGKS